MNKEVPKKNSVREIQVENGENQHLDQQQCPLLEDLRVHDTGKNTGRNDREQRTTIQKAISHTFKGTANLANHLPTGTVLAFQLLAPIFTSQGRCDTISRSMTTGLVALCGISCFLSCFTDSFKDPDGKVHYGITTFRGLWVIDGSGSVAGPRLGFIDFMHAFMSILVFAAVALLDQNVVNCFYPTPSEGTKKLLTTLPVTIGAICSVLFVKFPTNRHGIGFSHSPN